MTLFLAVLFRRWQTKTVRRIALLERMLLGRAGGSAIWKKMYHYFQLNLDEFMEHCRKRSNIKATNATITRKFGETLMSKSPIAQVNKLLAKIIAYNHSVVIHEMHENGNDPYFSGKNSLTLN